MAMKRVEHVIPFIDIVFQALGALIVVMATLQHVEAIPVNLASVGKEAKVVTNLKSPAFIVMSKSGLFLGNNRISPGELEKAVKNKEIILRVDKDIAYGEVMKTVSEIQNKAKSISLEVKKR